MKVQNGISLHFIYYSNIIQTQFWCKIDKLVFLSTINHYILNSHVNVVWIFKKSNWNFISGWWFKQAGACYKLAHKQNMCSQERSWFIYLSMSSTISQCGVCGKRSTAMALTGWKGSEQGIDLSLCRAKPALLIFLHPLLFLFPFSVFPADGVQSSIEFATRVSILQDT